MNIISWINIFLYERLWSWQFFFENVKLLFKDTWIVRLVSPAIKRNPIIHSPRFPPALNIAIKLKWNFKSSFNILLVKIVTNKKRTIMQLYCEKSACSMVCQPIFDFWDSYGGWMFSKYFENTVINKSEYNVLWIYLFFSL